ncbi:unnamed protein product [Linum tenue]|uniref:Uncharacterized protein n=1 Tax=Linum tenue TaxID=586396 RepID=A0AAV0J9W7_9ROSI|nr:unnamed protein product [Linum tenue]
MEPEQKKRKFKPPPQKSKWTKKCGVFPMMTSVPTPPVVSLAIGGISWDSGLPSMNISSSHHSANMQRAIVTLLV